MKTIQIDPEWERELYVRAIDEFESGKCHQVSWTKALAESVGNDFMMKALYVKCRVDYLKKTQTHKLLRADASPHQQTDGRTGKTAEARQENDNTTTGSQAKDERYYGRVLGLQGRVAFSDVRSHYRQLVAQYHPDKVSHLGPKLKALAEDEMKEINEAFAYFKRRYG